MTARRLLIPLACLFVLGSTVAALPAFAAPQPPAPPVATPRLGPPLTPPGPPLLAGPPFKPVALPDPPSIPATNGTFVLTAFTATSTSRMNFVNLSVTVTQNSPDGSDFAENPGSTTETHAFPDTVYVNLIAADGSVSGPFPATIDASSAGAAIVYTKTGHSPVSQTADYTLEVPGTLPSGTYTFELYTSHTIGDAMTFRMGPYDDPSWADDIVRGTTAVTPSLYLSPCV